MEAIRCQECGSTDLAELKPGRFVCAHCETIFNQPRTTGQAASCELEHCGVAAIGRCGYCGRAFCGSHKSDINECSLCATERRELAERAAAQAKERAERERQDVLEQIGAHPDRLEALLMAICFFDRESVPGMQGPDLRGQKEILQLLPDVVTGYDRIKLFTRERPWDTQAIGEKGYLNHGSRLRTWDWARRWLGCTIQGTWLRFDRGCPTMLRAWTTSTG